MIKKIDERGVIVSIEEVRGYPKKQLSFYKNPLQHIIIECNKKSRKMRKKIERNEILDKINFTPPLMI